MKAEYLICFIVTLSVAAIGCNRQESDLDFESTFSLIHENPYSALALINDIDSTALSSERARADYSLLKTMALFKSFVDETSTKRIDPAVKYYENYGHERKLMYGLYLRGAIHSAVGEYNSAILDLGRAEKLAEKNGDSLYLALVKMSKGQVFSNCYNNEEALRIELEGLSLFERIGDSLNVNRSKLVIAEEYLTLNRMEEAGDLCKELISSCSSDTLLMRRILPVYASVCVYSPFPQPELAIKSYQHYVEDYQGEFTIKNLSFASDLGRQL